MRSRLYATMVGIIAGSVALQVHADDVEGVVTEVDAVTASFVVEGMRFHTDARTEYDDGLTRFDDLEPGMRVEVDYRDEEGVLIATEIERDDD